MESTCGGEGTHGWRGRADSVVDHGLDRMRRFGRASVLVAVAAWEVYCRSLGYEPTLNDTDDLWAECRRRAEPESVVIVGDSRAWFDSDLDELERGLGKRPVQLALPGASAYPVLADLANDERFHGTVICSVVPGLFFAPAGPPVQRPTGAVKRFHGQTWAQRISHQISVPIEKSFAFLKQEDLTMAALLLELPIPDRPNAQVPPRTPPVHAPPPRSPPPPGRGTDRARAATTP